MREDGFMRVLVFNEGDFIVAQGLDFNIVASIEGDDINRLMQRFGLQAELNKDMTLPPVPEKFERIWRTATALETAIGGMTVRQVA